MSLNFRGLKQCPPLGPWISFKILTLSSFGLRAVGLPPTEPVSSLCALRQTHLHTAWAHRSTHRHPHMLLPSTPAQPSRHRVQAPQLAPLAGADPRQVRPAWWAISAAPPDTTECRSPATLLLPADASQRHGGKEGERRTHTAMRRWRVVLALGRAHTGPRRGDMVGGRERACPSFADAPGVI
ncbi:hypothetical protein BV25DRAFT_1236278 [Artomyces pyxidatus]|uniref:Uncharacterized protein n=1 Tax=Artomyces pyxidatus TaxID=48021 RepID=A0ACB8SPK6_9AGAM|nr:hypothetical protein BV25DRAFT_1236278 [Artomyces pyxidatus]